MIYFIDVQGTLISDEDKSPINGAIEFIDHLNATSTPYVIITNNTKHSSKDFYNSLVQRGFNIPQDRYIDPLMVLEESVPKDGVAAYGAKQFLTTLESMGYELNYTDPKSVLVAIKDDFASEEYAQMIEFLLSGSKLVGMHETSLYAKNSKRYPGVGAILKMLEFATSSSYEVVGKPSELFYEKAKDLSGAKSFSDITIISDDPKGDLEGAKALGMRCIFVTSGKYRDASEIVPHLRLKPDAVYADLGEVLKSL